MSRHKPVLIVQGGLFGSEAKGAVAHALCKRLSVDVACRTGSINAGHSVVEESGKKLVYQQLPVAAAIPDIDIVIGPGAYVHPETLIAEIKQSVDNGNLRLVEEQLRIDENCGVHLDSFTGEAKEAGRNLKIGATGKGCAEAIIHKIADRGIGKPLLFREHWDSKANYPLFMCDTAEYVTEAYHDGKLVMLEGTQGTLLDIHTGPYPFTTSRQTISSAWVVEAGLSPALDYEICLVVRTYPIRVAGNSGPMPNEIDWVTLARRMNNRLTMRKLDPIVNEAILRQYRENLAVAMHRRRERGQSDSEVSLTSATDAIFDMTEEHRTAILKFFETTTVTKRLRRIAELDLVQLRKTVKKEAPAYIALTFLNYVFPELASPSYNPTRELHDEAVQYVKKIQDEVGCWIRYVSIGPKASDLLETPAKIRPKNVNHWLQ